MKKLLIGIGIFFLLFLIASFVLGYHWSHTPYGYLDYKLAIGLKFLYESPDTVNFTPQQIRDQEAEEESSETNRQLPDNIHLKDSTVNTGQGPLHLRFYIPESNRPLPVVLYYHGGGFVFGTLNKYDNLCVRLANDIAAIVVSVDYRLAPEHPYPIPVNDSYAALLWVHKHISHINGDSTRIAVMGDSAGGNLATVVALKTRDLQGPSIAYQVLFYPPTNSLNRDTDSYQKFGKGFALTRDRIIWFTDMYLPHMADRYEPYASPLLAKNLQYLPPALIFLAGFDPLKDEGKAYAERLQNAGIPTKIVTIPDVVHGFISVGILDQREKALQQTIAALQQVFGSGVPELKSK